jgi:hypothetical protein
MIIYVYVLKTNKIDIKEVTTLKKLLKENGFKSCEATYSDIIELD